MPVPGFQGDWKVTCWQKLLGRELPAQFLSVLYKSDYPTTPISTLWKLWVHCFMQRCMLDSSVCGLAGKEEVTEAISWKKIKESAPVWVVAEDARMGQNTWALTQVLVQFGHVALGKPLKLFVLPINLRDVSRINWIDNSTRQCRDGRAELFLEWDSE